MMQKLGETDELRRMIMINNLAGDMKHLTDAEIASRAVGMIIQSKGKVNLWQLNLEILFEAHSRARAEAVAQPNVTALAELVQLVAKDTGALAMPDADEDSVGWGDHGPLPMTFGHVRRAVEELREIMGFPSLTSSKHDGILDQGKEGE